MYKYKFQISDYHAIRNADIAIDGITILTGENGSGKSTLSKWLYYLVSTTSNLESFLYPDFYRAIGDILRRIDSVRMDARSHNIDSNEPFIRPRIIVKNDIDYAEEMVEKAKLYIYQIGSLLKNNFIETKSIGIVRRSLKHISKESELPEITESNVDEVIDTVVNVVNESIDGRLALLRKQLNERKLETFKGIISRRYEDDDQAPDDMNLYEDGVNIIDYDTHTVKNLFGLDRAIYNDTPMSLNSYIFLGNEIWERFQRDMVVKVGEMPAKGKLLKRLLQNIISGDLKMAEEGRAIDNLYYIRQQDNLSIPVSKIATGYKTFSYIYQLLVNGYLTDKSLLLIDEPEAHLHPQWIVKFAEVLVLLNKLLGVKIVIDSHNPDMISAIKAVSMSNDIADNVHFYLAEKDKNDPLKFNYRDLGLNIEDIFKVFNIALERINLYGQSKGFE